jgi:hypothetical protein
LKEKEIKLNSMCILPFGTWLHHIIGVVTFGYGEQLAGWIAWTFFKNPDCGCKRRQEYLDKLFGCEDFGKIKL